MLYVFDKLEDVHSFLQKYVCDIHNLSFKGNKKENK